MQFKLAKTHRYWWPVTVRVPDAENAGQVIEQTLRVELEPLPQDEALTEQEALAALRSAREVADRQIAQMLRIVRNWDGVVDENGASVPFSEDRLRAALQHSWFCAGVGRAIADSLNGEAARLGN